MNASSTEQLFTGKWTLYQKVVAADYMLHRHFAGLTRKSMHKQAEAGAFDMLDIGCGDASSILDLLQFMPVKSYTGYDLSETALRECASNLSGAPYPLNLVKGNMEVLIQKEAGQFDLIYSSYAIHHLPDAEKAVFFQQVSNRLSPGGRFIYIDVYRQEGQSTETCRNKYTSWIRNSWNLLNEEEKEEVIRHIEEFDFPAPASELLRWARAAGLELEWEDLQDARHLFMCMKQSRH